jgi:hypothetical protein
MSASAERMRQMRERRRKRACVTCESLSLMLAWLQSVGASPLKSPVSSPAAKTKL